MGSVTGTTYHATWEGLDAGGGRPARRSAAERVVPLARAGDRHVPLRRCARAPRTPRAPGSGRAELRDAGDRDFHRQRGREQRCDQLRGPGGHRLPDRGHQRLVGAVHAELGPHDAAAGALTPAERRLRRGSGDYGRDGLGERNERAGDERVRRASPRRGGARRLLDLVPLDGAFTGTLALDPTAATSSPSSPSTPATGSTGCARSRTTTDRACSAWVSRRGRVQDRGRRRLARRSARQHRARMAALDHVADQRRVRRQRRAVGVDRLGRPERRRGERRARRALARGRSAAHFALVLVDSARTARVVPDSLGTTETVLAAYEGTSLASLSLVAANSEPSSGGADARIASGERGSYVRDRGRHAAHAGHGDAELADAAVAAERLVRERGPAPDRLLQHLRYSSPTATTSARRRSSASRTTQARPAGPRSGTASRGTPATRVRSRSRRSAATSTPSSGSTRARPSPASPPSRRTTTRRAAG